MLQEVIQSVGATGFVECALVLFFAVFVTVLVREGMRSKREVRRLSDMPLVDDQAATNEHE